MLVCRFLTFCSLIFLAACSQTSNSPLSSQAGSWQDVGGPLGLVAVGAFDMVLDGAGSPLVVWENRNISPSKVQVSDETSGVWTPLPDPARDLTRQSSMPAVALRSDNRPMVAYVEEYIENNQRYNNLYLRRWTGSSWVNYGNSLNFRKGYQVSSPLIALDKTGTNYPTIAWTEWNGSGYDARVIRRTVTGWQRLDALDLALSDYAAFGPSSLRLDKTGQPVVAWVNRSTNGASELYVKRWHGTSWQSYEAVTAPLNDTAKSLVSYALTLDNNDRPVVAWVEDILVNQSALYQARTLKVKRWNGTNWTTLLNERYNYQYFTSARDSLDIGFNALNQPVLTYTRWNGAKHLIRATVRDRVTGIWNQYGEVLNSNPPLYTSAEGPNLALQGNIPITAFNEGNAIRVRKWVP